MEDHGPLRKWNSCKDHLLIPATPRSGITKLHVYDFDNTLYCSPHPNRQLYTKVLYDTLFNSSTILDGGWWSEPSFLEQSFRDMLNSDEEQQAQYWNQEIIKLAQTSYEDPHTISVVLTGRKEVYFHDIFNEMFSSFGKAFFNAICLKRANISSTTAEYKISLIEDFLDHYKSLQELIVYDDRLAQVKKFEKVFGRDKVIHVQPSFKMLDMSEETRLVGQIFQRSKMKECLAWTPKAAGFILDYSSHKKLVRWTFNFFRKKYKMSSLPQWPTYIPLTFESDLEIARIWSNNDLVTVQSQDKVKQICDSFYSQPNLQGEKMFQFDVVKMGYSVTDKRRSKVTIFYKAIPADNAYVSSTSQTMFVISTEEETTRNPSIAIGVRWASLDRRIRVRTCFGHSERLTYVAKP
ncbi:hypothetical protein HG536_0H00810 [Torulaspora globosa]|uniref:Uncharacterized protein n=1 Tax=Torulaspora globosa TaxID=48254 RepID=A0A7G3ZMH0_9SACH|nr:uncharacterized protein HG536_0H00810 [Torulaspora globosa]QLL34706.1 hypothetical protein HG536_0H00810 [Torulaspora globosa]